MQVFPHIEAILTDFTAANQKALGSKLLGLYIYGSYMTGNFTIGISDLDMTAVLIEDLNETDLANLKAMHDQFAADHATIAGRIECQYVSKAALQTFRTVRHPMANISPGEPFHLIEGGHEWLSNWWMIRDHGRVLFGPPIQDVIPAIGDDEFFTVIRSYVVEAREWGSNYTHLAGMAYTTLTMFRALYTLAHRKHVSKLDAMAWAKEAYPQYAEMIDKAIYWREHHAEATDDPAFFHPIVMEIVEFACGECEQLSA
ncbi:MAG: aminoglycoside adenylyltransferase domain-containing protein [Anaerolineae bacterium]|jgi:hypothetical protein|nr:aminoglycoside adenylyltransferase domain-containing protein [Anaerolineae bacterium]